MLKKITACSVKADPFFSTENMTSHLIPGPCSLFPALFPPCKRGEKKAQ